MKSLRPVLWLGICLSVACSETSAQPAVAPQPQGPAEVFVVSALSETVPLKSELPGRISARRVAEIRARVPGILLSRKFEEGSDVKEGQLLFQIDPAPLRAKHDQAKATLKRAEANLAQITILTKRYAALIGSRAVSQQELDDAEAQKLQREAEIIQADAALRSAALDLSYATVRSPITGRVGKALVTEGTLVGQGEATRLAVVQQLDPVYFDFEQSSAELLSLRRNLASGKLSQGDGAAKISLVLDDGSEYEHQGKILFSDVTVDERTGMVTMRGEVPNPDGILLPGMFARARLAQAVSRDAITIPQRTVALGKKGSASVLVVSAEGIVEQRAIVLERAVGQRWVVTSGLDAGAKVIIEGRQKVRPGSPVTALPWKDPNAPEPVQQADAKAVPTADG